MQVEIEPRAEPPRPDPEPKDPPDADADAKLDLEAASPISPNIPIQSLDNPPNDTPQHKVYKRRFIGLIQLALLNLIVSWCWLTFAAVSSTTATYYGTSETNVNWLSTGFLFAFAAASPVTLWTLNKGVKQAMLVSSGLMIVGNWLRYAGTKAGSEGIFGLVVFGQILIGFAQPFVLSAPTRYSHMWLPEKERITATAIATLANPLGGAVGQLVGGAIVNGPSDIPNIVLYVAIISTVICLATILIPNKPPLPPCPTDDAPSDNELSLDSITLVLARPTFHLLAWPFIIYVAAFNSTSTLINQILGPYGFDETSAGIAGGVLIVAGLVVAAISSPILDRKPTWRVPVIIACAFTMSSMYLALIFAPSSQSFPGIVIICAIIGSASFIVLPLALEKLVDICHPVGPEVSSTICWAVSQVTGGCLVIAMDHMELNQPGQPAGTLYWGLVLQAVLCWMVAPMSIGLAILLARRKRSQA